MVFQHSEVRTRSAQAAKAKRPGATPFPGKTHVNVNPMVFQHSEVRRFVAHKRQKRKGRGPRLSSAFSLPRRHPSDVSDGDLDDESSAGEVEEHEEQRGSGACDTTPDSPVSFRGYSLRMHH